LKLNGLGQPSLNPRENRMRSSLRWLMAWALLIGATLSFGQSASQPSAADRLKQMAAELNLTDAQKEQIQPVLQDQIQKMQALKADTSLSRRERLSRAKAINDNAVQQIRPLLNAEQQKKYDEMREQMKEQAKNQARQRRKAQSQ